MFNIDRWREIFETISKNRLRTALAGFTVALGIIIFVVLYGLGNGLENTFQKFFKDDQLNTIFINPGRTSKPYAGFESNRRIEFDNDDLAEISETGTAEIDNAAVEETINEQGEVSLDEVSESQNQEADVSAEDTEGSNS